MSDDERERGLSLKACLERISAPCMHAFLRAPKRDGNYQLPKCIRKRQERWRKNHDLDQELAKGEAVPVSVPPEEQQMTVQDDQKEAGQPPVAEGDAWAKVEDVRFVPRSFQWHDLVQGKERLPDNLKDDAERRRERAELFLLAYLERVCEKQFRTSYETIKSEFEASLPKVEAGQLSKSASEYFRRRLQDAETSGVKS